MAKTVCAMPAEKGLAVVIALAGNALWRGTRSCSMVVKAAWF